MFHNKLLVRVQPVVIKKFVFEARELEGHGNVFRLERHRQEPKIEMFEDYFLVNLLSNPSHFICKKRYSRKMIYDLMRFQILKLLRKPFKWEINGPHDIPFFA